MLVSKMTLTLFKNKIFRIVLGNLIVSGIPAIFLFWDSILSGQLRITQINSIVVTIIAITISILLMEKFSRFPGQKSIITTIPIIIIAPIILVLILLIFHLEYSVYYLSTSLALGLLYCSILQIVVRSLTKPTIAYVPTGRSTSLSDIAGVSWVKLDKKNLNRFSDSSIVFNSIVADLSDNNLDADWERFLAEASLRGIPVYNVLQVRESLTGRLPIKHLYENNLGSLLPSPTYLFFKRLLDTVAILLTAPITLPIAALVALGIIIDSRTSGGSILFAQKRIGQGGKLFTMYKFRSMVSTSEIQGAKMATINDMRITRFGQFIRKMRLDELPQFINVLKGEMSLIGPRPEQPSFVAEFNETIPFYRYRHIVKPGITGWAQVMQGYASDEEETRTKLEYDFYYIKNFSFSLDLLIVIKTIQTMLTGFGAR